MSSLVFIPFCPDQFLTQIHTTQPPSTLCVLHMFSWTGLLQPPGTQCHCSPLPGRSPLLWTLEVFSVQVLTLELSLQDTGRWVVMWASGHCNSCSPCSQASQVHQPHLPPTKLGRWPQTLSRTPSRSHFPSALEAEGRRRPCYLWLSRKASGRNPLGH